MTELREKVARAIGLADGIKWDGKTVTLLPAPGEEDDISPVDRYFRFADAALAAIHPAPPAQGD